MSSPDHHERVKAIFTAALEQPFARRVAFVAAQTQGNRDLQRDVLELLLLHRESDDVLDQPQDPSLAVRLLGERTGDRAGRWWLRRLLGRGGMGVVYLADDADGRVAAVKLLARGIITPETRERFRLEAEILGRLSHPGLARILDSGDSATEMGVQRPWIAMEFVEGRPLLDHARECNLTLPQRLELLANVCDAVQHAHVKGVVHRDLKPSNILVRADGQPVVLDFGVARLVSGDERPTELLTQTGQMIGTPQYMSPEQVQGVPDAIGPASDVYSLGLIAYQLVSGALPYEASSVSLPRAVALILTTEPEPLGKVSPIYRGALERVVEKALEKQLRDRYPDAGALAKDLRRHLEGRTVSARGPALGRRIARWSRRRKRAAAALGVLLLAGLLSAAWLLGNDREMPREQVLARYREAESLTYQMIPLIYEGERTPDRMRQAIAKAERARSLIDGIPHLRHYPMLMRQLAKELGTAQYLLGEMTWDVGPLRSAMSVLISAEQTPVDTTTGWRDDQQIRESDLRVDQGELFGLMQGASLAQYQLFGEWASLASAHTYVDNARSLVVARNGPPPPASTLRPETAHNEPFAHLYNALAQIGVDRARYSGTLEDARLALSYSDSANARVLAFVHNWPAYGSMLFERGRAFHTFADASGEPAALDSAIAYLVECETFRGPTRPRVCAETRRERAEVRLDQARMARTTPQRLVRLRQAQTDIDSAIVLLSATNPVPGALAELRGVHAEVLTGLALAERSRARLERADADLRDAEAVLNPTSLPHAAGQLLLRRARWEAARAALIAPAYRATALQMTTRAVDFALAPRNDSLVIVGALRLRHEIESGAIR